MTDLIIMDKQPIYGYGWIEVFDPDGTLADYSRFDNLVTEFGDQYYAEGKRYSSVIADITGMQLGTGTAPATKTSTGAAIGTYISGSSIPLNAAPVSSLVSGSRQLEYIVTYEPGIATNAAITEIGLTNQSMATNSAAPAGMTVARAKFTAVGKGSIQTLVATWRHLFLGAP